MRTIAPTPPTQDRARPPPGASLPPSTASPAPVGSRPRHWVRLRRCDGRPCRQRRQWQQSPDRYRLAAAAVRFAASGGCRRRSISYRRAFTTFAARRRRKTTVWSSSSPLRGSPDPWIPWSLSQLAVLFSPLGLALLGVAPGVLATCGVEAIPSSQVSLLPLSPAGAALLCSADFAPLLLCSSMRKKRSGWSEAG